MNRRDIEEMRQRLAARSATDTEDHPAVLLAAGVLLAAVAILSAFL